MQHAAEVCSLLLEQNGYLYVCGDSLMARDVHTVLRELLCKESKLSMPEVDGSLKSMRNSGRLQVWICPQHVPTQEPFPSLHQSQDIIKVHSLIRTTGRCLVTEWIGKT